MKFPAGVEGQKGQGDENFEPVAANVFFEDVEDFAHGSGLFGFAGHSQEDSAKR